MRWDVLYLILGWTVGALTVPLALVGIATAFLDDVQMALIAFLPSTLLAMGSSWLMLRYGTTPETPDRLRDREAFATVALAYPVVVAFGAMPFWLGGMFHGPFTADVTLLAAMEGLIHSGFEAMSGFTTTGTTIIDVSTSPNCFANTEDCIGAQSRGLLLWRSTMQWLGGMGVIMLSMVVLSRVLGGGMALARAELTGPSLSRLRPKLAQTAQALWIMYLVLTLLEIALLIGLTPMNTFEAVNHGLTTMPSGGFSTTDDSIGHWDSAALESIILVFMFLAGVNFTLLYFIVQRQPGKMWADEEFKTYIAYLVGATAIITAALYVKGGDVGSEPLRKSLFQVVAIATSTGYGTADYMLWPVIAQIVILMLMVVGASAGSTAGGLKLLRISLAVKVARRQLNRLTHPRRIHTVRMNGEQVEQEQVELIVGMLLVWILLFAGASLLLALIMAPMGEDLDVLTVIGVTASALGNTGPAMGQFGPAVTWAAMPNGGLILTGILMWFGRLELLTAVILFSPSTWREPGARKKDIDEDDQNSVV